MDLVSRNSTVRTHYCFVSLVTFASLACTFLCNFNTQKYKGGMLASFFAGLQIPANFLTIYPLFALSHATVVRTVQPLYFFIATPMILLSQ